jgi:hypothetical protein
MTFTVLGAQLGDSTLKHKTPKPGRKMVRMFS